MTSPVVLEIEIDPEDALLLERLVGDGLDYVATTLDELAEHLLRHAADGVRRPGSWEREWIVQATGTLL